jgi:hypothetical protein
MWPYARDFLQSFQAKIWYSTLRYFKPALLPISCNSDLQALSISISYVRKLKRQRGPHTRYAGAWGEKRLCAYSFLTSVLEGGEGSASRPGRALTPGKGLPVPNVQAAGWALGPVWIERLEKISSATVGDWTPVVQFEVRHHTNWATRLKFRKLKVSLKQKRNVKFLALKKEPISTFKYKI